MLNYISFRHYNNKYDMSIMLKSEQPVIAYHTAVGRSTELGIHGLTTFP